jgi:hypothetical protein
VLDFLDDDGDGRADAEEVHALMVRGAVGDLLIEKRGKLLDDTRRDDDSSDDDLDGDWLLGGLASSSSMASSSGRFTRRRSVLSASDVANHPAIAKLEKAASARWSSDKDREALQHYLARHTRRDGTIPDKRFLR